jgi:hypothetical protein
MMSWSLQIRNGDLALNGASFAQVSGGQKLVQDLRCEILERRGNDDLHPSFGSLIDGGIDESGREATSLIASNNADYVAMRVTAEIRRIASSLQARQLERAQNDRYVYGKSTLDNGELLINISGIRFTQIQDSLYAQVDLQVGSGQAVTLAIPLADNMVLTT